MPDQESRSKRSHRQASVVFADVAGFTALSERIGSEAIAEVMESCFEALERIVLAHGGTVDKYIGDCVMALFGAEHALEDSAAHAARASLEMRDAVREVARRRGPGVELDMHIGVNTGPLMAGEIGGQKKRDFTVLGDTVNVASRLESKAETGTILVGPETYSVTRDRFVYEARGALELKGKSAPLPAYALLGLRDDHDALPTLGSATRPTNAAFIGRREDRKRIESHLEGLALGRGGIVFLRGEPGMGKSRLLLEITKSDALRGTKVLVGHSDEVRSEGASYQPLREALRGLAGVPAGDAETSVAKLRELADKLIPETAEENLPFLALVLDLDLPPDWMARIERVNGEPRRILVQKAVGELLAGLAGQTPVLLCLEDFHWADPSTVQFVESLLWLPRDLPFTILVVSRPGFQDTTERLAVSATEQEILELEELVLAPLTPAQARELAQEALGVEALPLELHEVVTVRSGGNPFHVEEIVRTLREHPAVQITEGRFLSRFDASSLDVPGSVREIIAGRIDRLDPGARHLLELMSIVGHRAPRVLLEALAPDGVDVEGAIRTLVQRELVEVALDRETSAVRRARFEADEVVRFRHALAQEAVYESLLERTRKELHGRVADIVEEHYADRLEDVHAMLALHHLRADRAERALPHLVAAGEAAIRSAASGDALSYFREAFRIHPELHGEDGDPEFRVQLEQQIARASLLVGDLEGARPFFDRVLEHLGERRPPATPFARRRHMAADLLTIFVRGFLLGGRSRRPASDVVRQRFELTLERARAQSIADPDRFLSDTLRLTAGITRVDPRSFDQSFALYAGAALLFAYSGLSFRVSRRFATIAKGLLHEDRVEDVFTYHLMLFLADYYEGNWDAPCGIDEELIEAVLKTGRLWDVDTYVDTVFYKACGHGDYEGARRWQKRANQLLDVYGYRFAATHVDASEAYLALEELRFDDALQAIERYLRHPVPALNLFGRGMEARVHVASGDLEGARGALAKCEKLVAEIGGGAPFHRQHYVVADAAFHVARLDGAGREVGADLVTRARRAARVALAGARRMASIRVEAYRLAGEIEFLTGRTRRAVVSWEAAIAESRRLGARPELARTHTQLARRLPTGPIERVGGLDAAAHGEAARALFAELGLSPGPDDAPDRETRAAG